eukprot:scaffold22056_cov113-Isochrysis_galbana.AAC.1
MQRGVELVRTLVMHQHDRPGAVLQGACVQKRRKRRLRLVLQEEQRDAGRVKRSGQRDEPQAACAQGATAHALLPVCKLHLVLVHPSRNGGSHHGLAPLPSPSVCG